MKINLIIPRSLKKYLKNALVKTYEKYNLGKKDEYRDYDNLKLKIISKLSKDSVCIDIGCNHGEVLVSIINSAPDAKHYAFEPIPELAKKLKKKFGSKIHFFDVALSDNAGLVDFNYVISNPAYSGFEKRNYPGNEKIDIIKVRTELLDNIIPPDTKITLIKIDVEGAEYFVLKGAIETLKRNKPLILFECGKGGSDYYNVKPENVFDLLAECGLQVSLMEYFLYNRAPLDRHEFIGQFNKGYNYEFVAYA